MKGFTFCLLISVAVAGLARRCAAQDHPATTSPSKDRTSCARAALGDERTASWKQLVPDILCDQKTIWTFPGRLGKDRIWLPTTVVVGTTAGLILLDPSIAPYFRRTSEFHGLDATLSGRNTAIAEVLFPVAFYGVSRLSHNSYGQQTALLMAESLVGAEAVAVVGKNISRRLQPNDIAPNGNFSDTWFKKWNGGFPSGHTVAAFSIATIVSHRYKSHKWVPYVAYGAATVLAFSRLTTSAHFPSDVFFGAALGYSISRFVVLR